MKIVIKFLPQLKIGSKIWFIEFNQQQKNYQVF